MSLSRLNGGRKMATFSHHAIVTSAKEVMFATVGWLVGLPVSRSAWLHKNYQSHSQADIRLTEEVI